MRIDTVSPAGSWQKEWDAQSHTPSEYQREIRELRDRVRSYLKEIEDLNKTIESMREELRLNDIYWQKMMNQKRSG